MKIVKILCFALGLAFLAGCETYPYASAFSSCDAGAGACYRDCEDFAETAEDGAACRSACEVEVDRCFDAAYAPYRTANVAVGYIPPWYGRFGAWYPNRGYIVSFGNINRFYGPRYGYNRFRYATPAPRLKYRDNRRRFYRNDRRRNGPVVRGGRKGDAYRDNRRRRGVDRRVNDNRRARRQGRRVDGDRRRTRARGGGRGGGGGGAAAGGAGAAAGRASGRGWL
ncbi:MAG: hypothetical protein AAGJ87_16590, partial [Pseudomonadota bacterium]